MTDKTTITVTRPNGHVETVDVSDKFQAGIPRHHYDAMVKATREAGRGEITACSRILEPRKIDPAESKRRAAGARRAMAAASYTAQIEWAGDINNLDPMTAE